MKRFPVVFVLIVLFSHTAHAIPGKREKWIEVRTENFVLYSDAGEGETKNIALSLERLRVVLQRLMSSFTVDTPVPFRSYIFRSEKSFERYMAPGNSESITVGYYMPGRDADYVAIRSDSRKNPSSTIYWGYVHHFLENNVSRRLPLWLDLGLANYYSTLQLKGDKVRIGYPIDLFIDRLKEYRLIPLNRLFRTGWDSKVYLGGGSEKEFLCGESWATVHMLMSEENSIERLNRYIEVLAAGKTSREAVPLAFGSDAAVLTEQLKKFLKDEAFDYVEYRFEEFEIDKDVRTRRLDYPETVFRLGDLLAHRTGGEEEARAHFEKLLEMEPAHTGALVGLAAMEIEKKDFSAALDHLGRAVEADEGDFLAHYYLGEIYRRTWEESDGSSAGLALRRRDLARSEYRRSIERNDAFAPACIGLASTYRSGDDDLGPGIEALTRAHELLPRSAEAAYALLLLDLASGDRPGAATLRDSFFVPLNDPDYLKNVNRAIDNFDGDRADRLIEAGEVDSALVIIDRLAAAAADPEIRTGYRDWAVRIREG